MAGGITTCAPNLVNSWLVTTINAATRWRGNTADANNCPHDCEGGVDLILPPGTPLYALAGGPLTGAGNFCHDKACNNPGYGVVTWAVPGFGQLYYQHIDIAPGINFCGNGDCGGQVIQPGQLVGHIGQNRDYMEVGINSTWGGIWGTNRDNSIWVLDPRQPLADLACSGKATTPVNPADALQDCKKANAGSCNQCSGGIGGIDTQHCLAGEFCEVWNQDGTVYDAPLAPFTLNGNCVSSTYKASHTVAATTFSPCSAGNLPDWLCKPDWLRWGKGLLGVLLILIGGTIALWPQISQVAAIAAV